MTTLNFSATRPVNLPGAGLKLTIEQLWAGLEKKARNPKGFIPGVESASVLEDTGDRVTREVIFSSGLKMKEYIKLYKPSIIYFDGVDRYEGFQVTNIISYDKDNNLQLTFSFAGHIPGFSDGETVTLEEQSQKVGTVIEGTVQKIRDLVREGTV